MQLATMLVLTLLNLGENSEPAPIAKPMPAEEVRLDTAEFREGLKRRGLTEFLEQHLRDFPPVGTAASLLMLREVKLAEAADPKRTPQERHAAAAAGNRILEQLLQKEKDDPRRFEWRFQLAYSLLYREGEPYSTGILFRGGSRKDRLELRKLTERAVAEVTELQAQLTDQYKRIDDMSVAEFEKLERAGFIEEIDRLTPRADYLLLWALFYDAIARDDADPVRAENLNRVTEALTDDAALVNTPHATSKVQVQALLLSGMAQRRLNNHPAARERLERALGVIERLDDKDEVKRVDWAVKLAWIERIRNDMDGGRMEDALLGVKRFQSRFVGSGDDHRPLAMVAALVERSVHLALARTAEKAGRTGDAQHHRDDSWQPLVRLARRSGPFKDELYATVYDLIGDDPHPFLLDPFEQCALVAGLISDAGRDNAIAKVLLEKAIALGTRYADSMPDSARVLAPELQPELRYNVAVAQFRLGRMEHAARGFLAIAQEHPRFANARQAAVFATELSGELHAAGSRGPKPEIQALYRSALHTLVSDYSDSETARYYRFPYAQLLEELGEFDLAASQYAFVAQDHELYLESFYRRVRCMGSALQQRAGRRDADAPSVRQRFNDFLSVQRDFVAQAAGALRREKDEEKSRAIRRMSASARLLLAEVQTIEGIDRALPGLETLENWESDFPEESSLLGRVWRVRLTAYRSLGRFQEFMAALDSYLASNAAGAGETLQSLYRSLVEEVEALRSAGSGPDAQVRADAALAIANHLWNWAKGAEERTSKENRYALTVQRAEAHLLAGQFEKARDLFRELMPADSAQSSSGLADPRIVMGYAESYFGLNEREAALPWFNRLATKLPPNDPMRWQALLRDLQCRAALGQPADGIIKVIQQQEFLYPDLGGAATSAQFHKLLRENERRRSGG